MREWKSTINITDEFEAYNNDSSVSIDALGKKVAEKIRANKFFNHPDHNDELSAIADKFEEECYDEIEEFNSHLHDLYDYGDMDKLIWIEKGM